jgi:DNA integrity scanning protein DisA with diadenylate cyclase activity
MKTTKIHTGAPKENIERSIEYKQQLRRVETALKKSETKHPITLKMKMTELILNLMQNRKNFGMFVILGWKNKWQRFADTPDAHQDIFARHSVNIMKIIPSSQKEYDIRKTINFDGAIIIDGRGNIIHSGAMIEGLRPRATAHKLNPNRTGDLSSQFGFKHKVHMRHIAAITSSYLFKNTTIFTISEETNDLHIFENGRIIYSTVKGEPVK